MLPRQDWVGKLTFLLSALNLKIYMQTIVQTRTTFCVCFVKLILNFFSDDPKPLLIPQVGPPPNIKKLFLRLSEWDDELLSTLKNKTFLIKSLSKLHEPSLSNVILYPLYTCFYLSLFLLD